VAFTDELRKVKPVYWWALGGAAVLYLLLRPKRVETAAGAAADSIADRGKIVIRSIAKDADDRALVNALYVAVAEELPQLPHKAQLMVVAQALVESGFKSGGKTGNNYWNVIAVPSWKGDVWYGGDRSYKPETCAKKKRPMDNSDSVGPYCKIGQTWRSYPTVNDAAADYYKVITQTYYGDTKDFLIAGDVDGFVNALAEHGYFDSTVKARYTANMKSLMKTIDRYIN
jgi:hypothetical protein